MWDSGVKVMSDVGASNFVVKEVNGTPWIQFVVWAINCVEGTLDEVVIIVGKVWDIDVCVLEPLLYCVERMNMRRHCHDSRQPSNIAVRLSQTYQV